MLRPLALLPILLLAIPPPTTAATIVQTTSFHFADAGSRFIPYAQFDPALGTLNAVMTTVTISGLGNTYNLQNFSQGVPVSFTASLSGYLTSDAGLIFTGSSMMSLTLGANQSTSLTPIPAISAPGEQLSYLLTIGLGAYIGTGTLAPFQFASPALSDSVTVDNSLIHVSSDHDHTYTGTEMITYFYSSVFAVPEPGSVVGMVVGIGAVMGVGWWRRRRLTLREGRG